jgi:hypothetical protein
VSTNLKAGKVRMVFVADEIPQELRRIVEFLNSQMSPADVLAVEIKQFTGQGLSTLVPRVLGQTAEAQQRKGRTESRKWDEPTFLAALTDVHGAPAAAVARRLMAWSKAEGLRHAYGRGQVIGSFQPTLDHGSEWFCPVILYTSGIVELQFRNLKVKQPFVEESARLDYLEQMNLIPGVSMSSDRIGGFPNFKIALITSDESYAIFEAALQWFVDRVQQSSV